MSATDNVSSVKFMGTLSVLESSTPLEEGYGDIELTGTLYVNTINENTSGNNINILNNTIIGKNNNGSNYLSLINGNTTGTATTEFRLFNDTLLPTNMIYYTSTNTNPNLFLLQNNSIGLNGNASIRVVNNNNIGLDISHDSGDILFNSTTPSTSISTGALISIGGISIQETLEATSINSGGALTIGGGTSIAKSIFIGKQLNALDGLHILKNTTGNTSVLSIQNTSLLGYSDINFLDYNNVSRLNIGYGNINVTNSHLSSTNYISTSGNTTLNVVLNGNQSILFNTNGTMTIYPSMVSSLVMYGGLTINNNTDSTSYTSLSSITTAGGISINKSAFIGDKLVIGNFIDINKIIQPSTPSTSNYIRFFIDSNDSLLKSIDNNNILTTYQPTNTKGDLTVHNGTTQVREPLGYNNQILTVDSNTPSGISWKYLDVLLSYYTTLTLQNVANYILDELYGAFYFTITNKIREGHSGIFVSSKNNENNVGTFIKISASDTYVVSKWYIKEELVIDNINIFGEYNLFITKYEIYDSFIQDAILTGSNIFTLSTELTGIYMFNIFNNFSGTTGTFIIAKNFPTSSKVFCSLTKSMSSDNNDFSFNWGNNSSLTINKIFNSFDGTYKYFNILNAAQTITISLTGTTPVPILYTYQRLSILIIIQSTLSGGPYAVFSITKNKVNNYPCITKLIICFGITTLETLNLTWFPQEYIKLYKTGNNYNGNYIIRYI